MENSKDSNFKDFYGNPINVGDTVMNFKLNFIEPRVWEVKEGEDGLVYCEGKYREESTFMELGELIGTPGVALVVLKDKKTEA